MLVDEGTTIVKVFLNVSKEEQRARLQERIDDPEKRWKFRKGDLDVRARFDDYLAAYDEVIEQTSTRARAVVRRPGRPQLGQGDRRRRAARRRARAHRPAAARSPRKASTGSSSSEPTGEAARLARPVTRRGSGARGRPGSRAAAGRPTSTMSTATAWAIARASAEGDAPFGERLEPGPHERRCKARRPEPVRASGAAPQS